MSQLWAKIRANYELKWKLTIGWNGYGFLNNTSKAKRWVSVNNWTNNNQNNEPTNGQYNMGNLAYFEFFFSLINENSSFFSFLFSLLFSSFFFFLSFVFFFFFVRYYVRSMIRRFAKHFFFVNTTFIHQEHVTSNKNRGVRCPNKNPNLILPCLSQEGGNGCFFNSRRTKNVPALSTLDKAKDLSKQVGLKTKPVKNRGMTRAKAFHPVPNNPDERIGRALIR
jgi:hypothetical protein